MELRSTSFETLLSDDFGNIQILDSVDNGIAEFRCSCEVDCSGKYTLVLKFCTTFELLIFSPSSL